MAAAGRIDAVIVVLDGLRPDMVTPDVMPNLTKFQAQATTYTNASGVFPSVTPVAAASIATGALPGQHGVLGSEVYWRGLARDRVLDLSDHRVARGADQASPGGLIGMATLADTLAAAMRRVAIVDGGAPVASTLLNPRAARHGHWSFSTVDRLATPTPMAWDEVVSRFGYPPERGLPRFDEVRFATDVLVDHVIGTLVPSLAVLWLTEPDATSRYREPGAMETESALRHADRQLGRVLAAIERRQVLDDTLVIVASDHGQISAEGEINVGQQMRLAQLPVGDRTHINGAGLVFAGRGYGSITATAPGHELEDRAARWLMEQPWVGNVLTAGGNGVEGRVPGTLSLELAGLAHERAPGVVFTFASDTGLDRNGVAGRGLHDSGLVGCRGTHGGLNPYEMSTVLMIAGPGFARGQSSNATAGILDIAPTVLARLGLPPLAGAVGRDLAGVEAEEPRRTIRVEAGRGSYAQHIVVAEAGARRIEAGARAGVGC